MNNMSMGPTIKDRLVIDIGRYSISYTVISSVDEIKFFKIDSFFVDMSYIFEEATIKFIERVIHAARDIKLDFPTIENTIIVIPTKDILLSSQNKITEQSLKKILETEYNITDEIDLVQSISRPYRIGNRYFTPVSFYDNNLDTLIQELDKTGNAALDRARSNIIFQTSLYRLISIANKTRRKIAVIDSSFTKTAVLLAKDGNPIEYSEFDLCGKEMIMDMYTKSSNKTSVEELIKILNAYSDSVANTVPEAMIARKYLFEEARKELIPHLRAARIDGIVFTGGLSHMDFLDPLKIPITRLNNGYYLTSKDYEIPDTVEYKVQMALETPIHGGLLDRSNIEIITGQRDINDFSINEEMTDEERYGSYLTTEEVIGEDTDLNNDFYLGVSKDIKKSLGQIGSDGNLVSKPEDSLSGVRVINLEPEPKEEAKRVVIKSITPEQEGVLDGLKKAYKKPSKHESKMPIVISTILILILFMSSLFALNYFGVINNNLFEMFGVEQPYRQAVTDHMTAPVVSNIRQTLKDRNINRTAVAIAPIEEEVARASFNGMKIPGKDAVGFAVRVPKDIDFRHNLGFYLHRNLLKMKNSTLEAIAVNIDTNDPVNNIYYILYTFEIDKKQAVTKDLDSKVLLIATGDLKWIEEEDRMFFDSNDYQDFVENRRHIGEPSRRSKFEMMEEAADLGVNFQEIAEREGYKYINTDAELAEGNTQPVMYEPDPDARFTKESINRTIQDGNTIIEEVDMGIVQEDAQEI